MYTIHVFLMTQKSNTFVMNRIKLTSDTSQYPILPVSARFPEHWIYVHNEHQNEQEKTEIKWI